MDTTHHRALLVGYTTAMVLWLLLRPTLPKLWPARPRTAEDAPFARPWRELGGAIVAAVAVLAVGQAYQRDWLFPSTGRLGVVLETVNQVLIFSPMVLLLAVRRHPLSSAWFPTGKVHLRVGVGLGLALASLASFTLVRTTMGHWPGMVAFVYRPAHLPILVQVFLEDLTIAILFVRLDAALRSPWRTAIVVAALFAAGHIPAALSGGTSIAELAPLTLDLALGIGVLLVVRRSADIWWFWCVHFALDMTQFFPEAG